MGRGWSEVLTATDVRSRGDATAEQRTELRTLLADKAVDPRWRTKFFDAVVKAEGLSTAAADDALLYLRSLADRDQQPTHSTPAQADALRRLLRSRIVPGSIARALLARHDQGELTYVQADRAIREWLAMARRPVIAAAELAPGPGAKAPDGYFTVTVADGTTRCYRIHTLAVSGYRVVEQIVTAAGKTRKLHGHEAQLVLREVAANPDEAAALYGRTRRHCSHCNQPLFDKKQPGYPHGYGRACWEEKQAARATQPPQEKP